MRRGALGARALAVPARRALVAALVALALAVAAPAAPARAQSAAPVVGAGSFNAAPILTPGSYSDTVLPQEYLYYGIHLRTGQRLHVSADAELGRRALLDLGIAFVKVNVASPLREPIRSGVDGAQSFGGGAGGADFTLPPVGTIAQQTSTTEPWTGPGVYFVSVYADYVGTRQPPLPAQIPFHFTLAVSGTPRGGGAPVASATPRLRVRATPTPTAARHGSRGASTALAAAIGALALLLGGAGGLLARRRSN